MANLPPVVLDQGQLKRLPVGSTVPLATVQNVPEIRIMFIGDSITGGSGTNPDNSWACCQIVTELTGVPCLTYKVSQTTWVSGTSSVEWAAGAPTGYLTAVIALMNTLKMTYCHVMIGGNDARVTNRIDGGSAATSGATYTANMLGICKALMSNGITPILAVPNWLNYVTYSTYEAGYDATYASTWIPLYISIINSLIGFQYNGLTVLQGDTQAFAWFTGQDSLFQDGVHPTVTVGWYEQARLQAHGIVNAIFGSNYASVLTGGRPGMAVDGFLNSGSMSNVGSNSFFYGGNTP